MRQDRNLHPLHGNDIRRRACAWLSSRERVEEVLIIVGNDDADTERPKDEEGGKAIEDAVEGAWQHLSWILGFTSGHRDIVGAGDSERGLYQAGHEPEEAADVACCIEFREGCTFDVACCDCRYIRGDEFSYRKGRTIPVPEAVAVMQRIGSEHREESEHDDQDSKQHFPQSQPKFGFCRAN